METSTTGLLTLLLAAGMAILPPRASAQDRNRQPEAYSAVAVGTGGPMGGRSILFDFQITDDTSEEDLQNRPTPEGQGSTTIITSVTARNMPFLELYRSGRTTDYPFGFLQVSLNGKGEGTGQIMAAAKLRFDKKEGHYEIESYGNQYIKAVNVRPLK